MPLVEHWVSIYSYLGDLELTIYQRVHLRRSCTLFNEVEMLTSKNSQGTTGLLPLPKGKITVLALAGCPNLKSIKLVHCHCHHINNASMFALVRGCRHLTSIDLTGGHHKINDKIVIALSTCPDLRSINLTGCHRITDDSVVVLANGCPDLESITLSHCTNITALSVLALVNNCPQLTSFDLGVNRSLTDENMLAIATGCPQLTSFNIRNNHNITNLSVIAMAIGCPQLTSITLWYCTNITRISVVALAHECSQLTFINVCYCENMNITNACVKLECYPPLEVIYSSPRSFLPISSLLCITTTISFVETRDKLEDEEDEEDVEDVEEVEEVEENATGCESLNYIEHAFEDCFAATVITVAHYHYWFRDASHSNVLTDLHQLSDNLFFLLLLHLFFLLLALLWEFV